MVQMHGYCEDVTCDNWTNDSGHHQGDGPEFQQLPREAEGEQSSCVHTVCSWPTVFTQLNPDNILAKSMQLPMVR